MENSAWKSTLVVRNLMNSQLATTSCSFAFLNMHTLGPWEMTLLLPLPSCGMVLMPTSKGYSPFASAAGR